MPRRGLGDSGHSWTLKCPRASKDKPQNPVRSPAVDSQQRCSGFCCLFKEKLRFTEDGVPSAKVLISPM